MYGLKTYYQDGDNLEHVAKAPNFKEMMSFANELYTEGLLDKEVGCQQEKSVDAETVCRQRIQYLCSYWDTDAANTAPCFFCRRRCKILFL